MSKLTRRRLLQSAAAGALLPYGANAAISISSVVQSTGGGGGSSNLPTTVVIAATTGAIPNNSYVRFGHPFGASDLPSGQILSITDNLSTAVPYTAMARSTGGSGTATRFADNVVRIPNGVANAPATVSSITHSTTTATATVTGHGLSTGNLVLMTGQAPDDYCGLYPVTVTGLNTFTYVMPTTPATNATTAGTMCYTRALTLNATTGSWNNTLPNSKTVANLITDATTNFDNLTLTLSSVTNSAGSPVASGTFNADLATALSNTGTSRALASRQGSLVCDLVGIMKFNDSVTPTTHLGSMSAWFYATLFLDQTTGAVVEIRCVVMINNALANTAMDYYTYQATLKLGSTVVRSTGLSSSASIDGKLQSFLPAAVNTSTGVISIPNHGFVGGETTQLTNSGGALPSGFSTTTDYGVIWIDTNNIMLNPGSSISEGNQLGNSSPIIPSTQGTGTHTVACWLHSATRNNCAYVASTGIPDRWTGKTGALAVQGDYVVHNNVYLQATKMVPPVDLTINLLTKAAIINTGSSGSTTPGIFALDRYCYGGLGSMAYATDQGGAGGFHEYGGPWTDKPLRKVRYCADPGAAQTVRVDALMEGSWNYTLINDDTTWRMPVVNNGSNHAGTPYTGLPTPAPNSFFRTDTGGESGFTAPTSTRQQNGVAFYSFSHTYVLVPRAYFFEGGQHFHDLNLQKANARLLSNGNAGGGNWPAALQISLKEVVISGTTYYVWVDGSEERTDAWTMLVLSDAVMLADDTCVEKPYIKDQLNDFQTVIEYWTSTYAAANDPNFSISGGLGYNETAKGAPGSTSGTSALQDCDAYTSFMCSYQGEVYGYIYRNNPSSNLLTICNQLYTEVDVQYRLTAGNGWFGNSYSIRTKQAAGLNVSPNGALSISAITLPMVEDSNLSHPLGDLSSGGGILYRTDGTIIGCSNGNYQDVFPATGDQHYLTNTDSAGTVGQVPYGWSGPPSSNTYETYFVRQATGSYFGWKYATTNSDATIITSYPALMSTTLSAAVTTTGQTTFQTADVPQFAPLALLSTVSLALMNIGTELVRLVGNFRGPYNLVSGGALVTSSGSPTVTCTITGHGLSTSDKVRFTNTDGSTLTVGGLTLSGADLTITVTGANTFTVAPGGNASSNASNASGCYWNANRFTVTRANYGSTASTYTSTTTIYVPLTSTIYADYQNRPEAFPPTGHCYRAAGSAGFAPDGYLTMKRAEAFIGWLIGSLTSKTAFNNADLWFNDAVVIAAGGGPPAFAANNTLKDSVNTTFTS